MTKEAKLKKQLENCKEWARKSRLQNVVKNINEGVSTEKVHDILMMQIAIEQIINYLDMQASIKE